MRRYNKTLASLSPHKRLSFRVQLNSLPFPRLLSQVPDMTQTTSEGLPAPRRGCAGRKSPWLGMLQGLNQHGMMLWPKWVEDTRGKEARGAWMWFLPCSSLTFSLALQTFLGFFLSFHLSALYFFLFPSLHPLFFLSFLSSPCHSQTLPVLNLLFALTSVHFFIASACPFPSSLSLPLSFSLSWG